MGALRTLVLPALLILSIRAVPARAGSDAGHAGEFLRQEVGGRGAALAGALTAVTDDSASVYWNPAGLSRLTKPEIAGSHVLLFEDTTFDYVGGGASTRWGGLGAAYVRQASGGFERRTTPFDSATRFSITQSAFMAGWGAALPIPVRPSWVRNPKPLEIGVAFKSVREAIDTVSASGQGADLGLILRPGGPFILGLAVQNLWAPELTFISRPVRYPRIIDFSPAARWELPGGAAAVASVRVSKTEDRSMSASGGLEFDYRGMGTVRLGIGEKGLSTGIGAALGNTRFDYGVLLHDLGLSHVLSFSQRFGHTPAELEAAIRKGIRKFSRSEARRLAKTYVRSAELKLRGDRLAEALKDLEAAALWDPEDADIPGRVRRVRERLERSLRARMVANAAALARREFESGNFIASRQYWRSVLETDPANAEAAAFVSRINARLSEEQRRSIEELRRKEEDLKAREHRAAAKGLMDEGKLKQAVDVLEKSAASSKEDDEARMLLEKARKRFEESIRSRLAQAKAHSSGGRHELALKLVETVLADAPENQEALRVKSVCRAALSRVLNPEARKKVERLYYRAVEQYLKGNFKQADAWVDQVLRIDSTSESARKLKAKIDAARRIGGQ